MLTRTFFFFVFSPVTERVCSAPDCCWRGEETTGKFGNNILHWASFCIKLYFFSIPPEVLFLFFFTCVVDVKYFIRITWFCKGTNVLAQSAAIFNGVFSRILLHWFKNCFLTISSLPAPHSKITSECCCTFPLSHLVLLITRHSNKVNCKQRAYTGNVDWCLYLIKYF